MHVFVPPRNVELAISAMQTELSLTMVPALLLQTLHSTPPPPLPFPPPLPPPLSPPLLPLLPPPPPPPPPLSSLVFAAQAFERTGNLVDVVRER